MAEVLATFTHTLLDENRVRYRAQACGAPMPDGTWQGWIEFLPLGGGAPVRSGRETTQPNRRDTEYWATGLTAVYLEGALRRARHPIVIHDVAPAAPAFGAPEPIAHVPAPSTVHDAVLTPFSVYETGEALLRRQLSALSAWHLVNIIEAYHLSDEPVVALNRLPAATLIDTIVAGVAAARVAAK
jgi:hypothetical protein